MPLRLDIRKKLNTHSERVKCVDFHETESYVLSALYSGIVVIHDWENQSLVKSFEVSQMPIRCAKFIERKQWIVTGGDDMMIRCYNANTLEKLCEVTAHIDYIRYLAVHSTLPYVLSASDDLTVKLWDWEHNWSLVRSFEGHLHYVMMCKWNPKDHHIFATASMDSAIRIWGIQPTSSSPGVAGTVTSSHYMLQGHTRGVNCIEYSTNGEKPYLVSGGDDHTIRVWDYQTRQCIKVLHGHSRNVCAAVFHPRLPIIVSGGEDGTIKIWHSSTYNLESTATYHMGRLWAIETQKGLNTIAAGYDEGTVVLKLGKEEPIAAMHGSKLVCTKGSELQSVTLKAVDSSTYNDGDIIPCPVKELGSCDTFPQQISFHPNGRFIAVCGDEEYTIYTTQALRSMAYGRASELVWSQEGMYAVRDETKITIFDKFKEFTSFRPSFAAEAIFGGKALGVRSSEYICFYDWLEGRLIRRIDVCPSKLFWNQTGQYVCLVCDEASYILRHDPEAIGAAIAAGVADSDEGIECAFELMAEINDKVETALWVKDCLVFVSSVSLRLQTFIGGQTETLFHLETFLYLLGYLTENNKLYLIDKDSNIISYTLNSSVIDYLCAVTQNNFDSAVAIFPVLPSNSLNRVAKFLECQGYKEKALSISTDPDHQFELALSLGRLELCCEIIQKSYADLSPDSLSCVDAIKTVTDRRWNQTADAALEKGNITLAVTALKNSNDLQTLLMIASCTADEDLMKYVAENAKCHPKYRNIAFISYFLLHNAKECIEVLLMSNKFADAVLFSYTYCPAETSRLVGLWKNDLKKINEQLPDCIADPNEHRSLFPNFAKRLETEQLLQGKMISSTAEVQNQQDT